MNPYRRMSQAGLGDWYGAFSGQRLVADRGIFHADRVGRFHMVQTHPEFRRRGIGAALVAKSARQAPGDYDLHMLVTVTEHSSAPQRLYESIGFQQCERQAVLARRPGT